MDRNAILSLFHDALGMMMVVARDALIKPADSLAYKASNPLVHSHALQQTGRGRHSQGFRNDCNRLAGELHLLGSQGDAAVGGVKCDSVLGCQKRERFVGGFPVLGSHNAHRIPL